MKGAHPPPPSPDPALDADGQLIVRVGCSAGSAGAAGSSRAAEVPAPPAPPPVVATVQATVPGGSTGEVHVPLTNAVTGVITESGTVVWRDGAFVASAVGVGFGGSDGRFVWFTTMSGNYSFAVAHV